MPESLTLDGLREAVTGAAAFRCRTKLLPIGGENGDKVFPPTYVGGVYAVEDRRVDGRVVRCVLLDSVQSQANRMEEVLQEAFLPDWREVPRDGEDPQCDLPVVGVYVENHGWITSLTAPHRIHDAILRDSNLDGTRFRDSGIGADIVKARIYNAEAFYRYCPTALLFGTWDSTSGEGLNSAKIPRAVVSEIVGVDVTAGVRTASRIDPLGIRAQSATIYRRTDRGWAIQDADGRWIGAQLQDLEKDKEERPKKFGKGKPSDINHGNVTPDLDRFGDAREVRNQHLDQLPDVFRNDPVELKYEIRSRDGELRSQSAVRSEPRGIRGHAVRPGGITMAYALRTWTLSLTQLRRLRFPVNGTCDEERNNAARTVLAALGIYALSLQGERGYWLRSRCELVSEGQVVVERVNGSGNTQEFSLPTADGAKRLFTEAFGAAERAKITWAKKVFRLTPTEQLKKLVEMSDNLGPQEDGAAEDEAAADAGNPS